MHRAAKEDRDMQGGVPGLPSFLAVRRPLPAYPFAKKKHILRPRLIRYDAKIEVMVSENFYYLLERLSSGMSISDYSRTCFHRLIRPFVIKKEIFEQKGYILKKNMEDKFKNAESFLEGIKEIIKTERRGPRAVNKDKYDLFLLRLNNGRKGQKIQLRCDSKCVNGLSEKSEEMKIEFSEMIRIALSEMMYFCINGNDTGGYVSVLEGMIERGWRDCYFEIKEYEDGLIKISKLIEGVNLWNR